MNFLSFWCCNGKRERLIEGFHKLFCFYPFFFCIDATRVVKEEANPARYRRYANSLLASLNDRHVRIAFRGTLGLSMIHQHTAHHLRRNAHELAAVAPVDVVLVYQTHVSFMNKRRRLQRVIAAFPAQIKACQPPQLVIDDGQSLIQRLFVAAPEIFE